MRKTFLLAMATIVAVIVGIIAYVVAGYFLNSKAEARDAKEFIEEKHGMSVVIISETKGDFLEQQSYTMAFEDQRDVVFNVTVETINYSTIYRDDYPAALALHRLQEQADELQPEIEAIGFSVPSDNELADHVVKSMETGDAVRWLNLETDDSYETIELPEIEKMKELLDLQREYDIDVHKIFIENKREEYFVTLDLRTIEGTLSVEEVEAHIVGSDLRLARNRMQAKWQDAASQAESERFRFFDEWHDGWISCHEVNTNGDCINLLANVTFSPGELSQQNPHLEEDLDAIFAFFDAIEPQLTTVDLVMTDRKREGDPVRFFLTERQNYASTGDLIQALVR